MIELTTDEKDLLWVLAYHAKIKMEQTIGTSLPDERQKETIKLLERVIERLK